MSNGPAHRPEGRFNPLESIIRFFLYRKLVAFLVAAGVVFWGLSVAPFDWKIDWLPRRPIPVDAIPNLGDNQQIVYTEWEGRSPRDVEDQVTYPLTVSLLGVPGVREVRSQSMFGFATAFVIFEEDVDFYWARSRLLEKLNSLPPDALPEGVRPMLGPDATALGQVFWYTLQGLGPDGKPTGGWDLDELRTIQDWHVRYGLLAAGGVSEVASIGGYQAEYQVEVNPDAMRAAGATLEQIVAAVQRNNLDAGAGAMEINRVEYFIRGKGFVKSVEDLEQAVVRVTEDHVAIRVRDVAHVSRGPGPRRGALTYGGAETVGGVVVVREGANPLEAIGSVKRKIAEMAPGLPAKAVVDWEKVTVAEVEAFAARQGFDGGASPGLHQENWLRWLRTNPQDKWPEWVTLSQLTVVPFYDRTGLIYETLGTLGDALVQQILVTIVVVVGLVLHLRTAFVLSAMLPLAVLFGFIAMSLFGVDAHIVALAGIAIAIGTIVDMGVIVIENVRDHLKTAPPEEPRIEVVLRATTEVGSAVLTAISTTIVSFLPVFTMTGAEGKMFVPLAFTKTFVLIGSILVVLTLVPAAGHLFIAERDERTSGGSSRWRAWIERTLPARGTRLHGVGQLAVSLIALAIVLIILTHVWEPLGAERGGVRNFLFLLLLVGGILSLFWLFAKGYKRLLEAALRHKKTVAFLPLLLVGFGLLTWFGFQRLASPLVAVAEKGGLDAEAIRGGRVWTAVSEAFPGFGREFLPTLDEGTFLWMPTTMPHASIGEALDVLQKQDLAIETIPEVERVIGKIGRAETALDPAPIGMIETIVHYKSEYITDSSGRRIKFRFDQKAGEFVRDEHGELIPDPTGRPYRQWRDTIRTPDDIWDEIVRVTRLPGTTSAPPLQPIQTRLVMLQTGMRAPVGIKLRAPDLATLDAMAIELEGWLRQAPGVDPATVNAERVVGKPYLEVLIDRSMIARHGLTIEDVQDVISTAIGGRVVTRTVQGRERFAVRVRYPRELRNDIEDIERIFVAAADGTQVPLVQLADIQYVRGPEMIRGEDTFLTAYITFAGVDGLAEVDVVEAAREFLNDKIATGKLAVPAGVSWRFAGNYEHQLRAAATLRVVLPVALAIIFLLLYFQFGSAVTTTIVFSGIAIAWAGGFILMWLYGQNWFADFSIFGVNMRDLFRMGPMNLSVAVWVGFLALFGVAVDNGVVLATYIQQGLSRARADGRKLDAAAIRQVTVDASLRRLHPCLITTATTILALLPVLTSTGRGASIMAPMAIPSAGGMVFVLLTLLTVPVLICWVEETRR